MLLSDSCITKFVLEALLPYVRIFKFFKWLVAPQVVGVSLSQMGMLFPLDFHFPVSGRMQNKRRVSHRFCATNIFDVCDVYRDLVLFLQFKKREKHTWRSFAFNKVNLTKSNTPPGCFLRFLNCKNGAKLRNASHIHVLPFTSHCH